MDTYLFFTAFLSFCLFLAGIAVLFRFTRPEAAIIWMIRTFVGIAVVTVVAFGRSWSLTLFIWWASLYGLLTVLFVFGPFSIMEASLTIRLFTEIARSGRGMTTADLMKHTDRSHIIRRRIDRLLYSGEIREHHGVYMRGQTSYFGIREVVLGTFRRLFP